ncbi:MAG: DinB family protein [Holophagaceae bacterium]|nr:DinB family protein [Holophagaceae bacterium]
MSLSAPLPTEYDADLSKYLARAPEGDVLALLGEQSAEVTALFTGLTEAQAAYRYAAGKWSLKDLLQHLIDVERIFTYRCLRIGRGDTMPLPGFDDNAFAEAARADDRPVAALLEDFQAARASSLALFRSLPEEAWLRLGSSNGRALTARCIPYFALGHATHHLAVARERYLPGLQP